MTEINKLYGIYGPTTLTQEEIDSIIDTGPLFPSLFVYYDWWIAPNKKLKGKTPKEAYYSDSFLAARLLMILKSGQL
jgi:hypothetical protein